ncbi:MAG TPA: tetratricopeptide repeat protein [Gemmatimonadaceae bacterium]|nr:tetratricopeptide repeat protein [Gemmatimonadaceae bacterium]
MSNVAKLKKRALEYEQKKQFDKALDTYMQILAELDEHIDEADVALYNRVGDLLLRRGDVSEAVDHYEKAVDLYTDGGFFNNAIALCNKILRNAPGRSTVYYKLGKISARKGFISDAKQNFLEYADRMQKGGQLEEAFRALKEFADLCPDQDDIRLMLADQLVKKNRKAEAIEQLQALFEKYSSEGRGREAQATADRMKAIDPDLEPQATGERPIPKSGDLIFLDVKYDELPPDGIPPRPGHRGGRPVTPRGTKRTTPGRGGPEIVKDPDLPLIEVPLDDLPLDEAPISVEPAASAPLPELSHGANLPGGTVDAGHDIVSHVDSGLITGFEQTNIGGDAGGTDPGTDVAPLLGMEPTSASPLDVGEVPPLEELGTTTSRRSGSSPAISAGHAESADEVPEADLPMLDVPLDDEEMAPSSGGARGLTLIFPDDEAPSRPAEAHGVSDAAERRDAEASGPNADEGVPFETPPRREEGSAASAPPEKRAEADAAVPALAPLRGLEPLALPDEPVPVPREEPEPIARRVDRLRDQAAAESENWDLRRQYGEALLEDGERTAGLGELEVAMRGFDRAGDIESAARIADELARLEPGFARYHQKRVEFAVRANDRVRLVDAYLDLAECLLRAGQMDKSRAVYNRVAELAPDDPRARLALQSLGGEPLPDIVAASPEELTPVSPNGGDDTWAGPRDRDARDSVASVATPPDAGDRGAESDRSMSDTEESFVNLADWLREDESPRPSRSATGVDAAPPDDEMDFATMLTKFKHGVAASVEDTDHESHYDLGVAYKEMGLLDEAIAEFQKALRGTEQRVRTYEALGQCFVEKRQFQIAQTILARALGEGEHKDDTLVGVLYLLGYASEALEEWADAQRYYERVFAVDIRFRDVSERLAAVERHTQ